MLPFTSAKSDATAIVLPEHYPEIRLPSYLFGQSKFNGLVSQNALHQDSFVRVDEGRLLTQLSCKVLNKI